MKKIITILLTLILLVVLSACTDDELGLLEAELEDVVEQVSTLGSDNNALQSELDEAEETLADTQAALLATTATLTTVQAALEAAQSVVSSHELAVSALETALTLIQSNASATQTDLDIAEEALEEARASLLTVQGDLFSISNDLTLLEMEIIDLQNELATLPAEKTSVDISEIYTLNDERELVAIAFDDNTVDFAYRILQVENGIIEQLTTWVTTDVSEIETTTGRSTSETITAGISTSLSLTAGIDFKGFKVETTLEISASLERAVSEESSNSVSLTFPLDGYVEDTNYAVFLTGNYDVYQIFSEDIVSGQVTDYIVFKITSSPVTRLISSTDTSVISHIDINNYSMKDNPNDNFFQEGDGTDLKPYEIKDENGLFAMLLNPDLSYILVDDITLVNYRGSYDIAFTGSLNGDGHTISDLKINIPVTSALGVYTTGGNYGFFSTLEGEVKNITFDNVSIEMPYTHDVHYGASFVYAGAIAGEMSPGSQIENIIITDSTVSVQRSRASIGGVVGLINSGRVRNAEVKNSTIDGCGTGGGIVGEMHDGIIDEGKFIGDAENLSHIIFYSTGVRGYFGGIAGYTTDSSIIDSQVEFTVIHLAGDMTLNPVRGIIVGTLFNGIYEGNTYLEITGYTIEIGLP